MTPAGYSGTPLPKKLGIREGARVALLGAPAELDPLLDPLPADVALVRGLRGTRPFDVVLAFCRTERELERGLAAGRERLTEDGGLWLCWPKKSSGLATELADGVVRERGLASGLVDNKVCAVDETWSGLRFVVRRADRRKKA